MSQAVPERSVHYVDNKQFYQEMIQFKEHCATLPPGKRPTIPRSIADKIMLICERLSRSREFISSPHREEMVLDAIENCIRYIENFDPSKFSNPFAYFSQIAYYACIRRSQAESRHFKIKVRYAENAMTHDIVDQANRAADDSPGDDTFSQFANHLSSYMNFSAMSGAESKEFAQQPQKKKRTTLAYQKKKKEEAEREIKESEKLPDSVDDITSILNEDTGAPLDAMDAITIDVASLVDTDADTDEQDS